VGQLTSLLPVIRASVQLGKSALQNAFIQRTPAILLVLSSLLFFSFFIPLYFNSTANIYPLDCQLVSLSFASPFALILPELKALAGYSTLVVNREDGGQVSQPNFRAAYPVTSSGCIQSTDMASLFFTSHLARLFPCCLYHTQHSRFFTRYSECQW
jgi:hypothetical protein